MVSLGSRIKRQRELLGLSQEELAKKMGYKSRSSINKIELDINDISQSKIMALAQILKTTPAYLMGWENSEQEKKPVNDELEENIVIYHRDGKTVRKKMSKEKMEMLTSMIDAIPEDNNPDL